MTAASPLTIATTAAIQKLLAGPPDPENLTAALRYLAKWRSALLANSLRQRSPAVINHGPFKGMIYDLHASEGAFIARRLGCYEASLAPIIETIVTRAYPLVIDIGCAEGYYAVGLARRMPGTTVWARDANPDAQALYATLAAANDVADRVEIGGIMTGDDLDICARQPCVVICDIEGAEDALLRLDTAPGLRMADILVEVHETITPGLPARLTARFAQTHQITRIDRKLDDVALPVWMEQLGDLDRLLALWEWRTGPTPWLWMQHKPAA